MGFWHVFKRCGVFALDMGTGMAGYPFSFVETFHGISGVAHIQFLLDQLIGYRVVMPFKLHVVVDVDTDFPLCIGIGALR